MTTPNLTTRPTTAADALAAPLSRLEGWWLDVRCRCGRSATPPLRLLARRHGGDRSLTDVVRRFACRSCGQPPVETWLCQTPNRLFCYGVEPGWSILLYKLTNCEVVNL